MICCDLMMLAPRRSSQCLCYPTTGKLLAIASLSRCRNSIIMRIGIDTLARHAGRRMAQAIKGRTASGMMMMPRQLCMRSIAGSARALHTIDTPQHDPHTEPHLDSQDAQSPVVDLPSPGSQDHVMQAASQALGSLQEASASASEAVARMDAFVAAAETAAPAHQALAAAEEAVRASMKCMELDGKASMAVDPGAASSVGQYVDALGPAEDALRQVRASAEKAGAAADAMLRHMEGLGMEASRAAGEEAGSGVLSWEDGDEDEKEKVEEEINSAINDVLMLKCEQRGYECGLMTSNVFHA